jgi:hypothetical protein
MDVTSEVVYSDLRNLYADDQIVIWAVGVPLSMEQEPRLHCEGCGASSDFKQLYLFHWPAIDYELVQCRDCATNPELAE